MRLSVVIVARNGWAETATTLQSLEFSLAEIEAEVLVVDDGSTDGTGFRLWAEFPGAFIVAMGGPAGIAAARNAGLRSARGEFVAFVEQGACPHPGWAARAIDTLADESIAALAAMTLYPGDKANGPIIGHCGQYLAADGLPVDLARGWRLADVPTAALVEVWESDTAGAGALIVRREVALELRGFDSVFRGSLETADFCRRVWASGHRVVTDPAVRVTYPSGWILPWTAYAETNRELFVQRWAGTAPQAAPGLAECLSTTPGPQRF